MESKEREMAIFIRGRALTTLARGEIIVRRKDFMRRLKQWSRYRREMSVLMRELPEVGMFLSQDTIDECESEFHGVGRIGR